LGIKKGQIWIENVKKVHFEGEMIRLNIFLIQVPIFLGKIYSIIYKWSPNLVKIDE